MEEVVLSDDLVIALSEQIDIPLYPISHFAVDLGFNSASGSVAAELAIHKQHPQGKYEHLLNKFVATHGRGEEAAQYLIYIFKDKKKMLLVNFLEKAIEKHNALNQSGRRQEPGPAEGQGHTGPQSRPLNAGVSARNKSFWKYVAGLSSVVALLAIAVACYIILHEPGKCASSPCQNGGTCLEHHGAYSCTCRTGYGGSNCVTELVKCASSPCQNGGTCHEHHGAYSCTCRNGYGGSNCGTEYIAENFSLEECQDTLREHYENHLFNIHTKPWDPKHDMDLEKLYTTVSIYKEDNNNIPDKPLQISTLNGSVNDIFQTEVRGSLPKRIVLFGEAGRGKTTAVAKLTYDWANKKEDSPLKNVKLLFVFKMRNLNAKTVITEAIVPLLGKKYKKYQKQLEEYIDSHEKDIVMLFDGYDEFSGELHCGKNVGSVIDILCQERCRRCRVLVTSRPVREEDFNSRNVKYSKMLIEGYSQQHATDFIDKFFFSNETKGTELKKYLREDIVINEMIATPLFCTMVCYLWNDGYIHGNFTRTKLFHDIMEFLRTHMNAKYKREIKRDLLNDTVVSVGKVALRKLSNKNDLSPLVLSEDDFSEVHDDILNISYSLGLLTKNMKTDSDTLIHIEFFHKLAQEYSAGRYLALGIDEGRISTTGISKIIYNLKEIFQFASGTSVLACRKILASLSIEQASRFSISNRAELYHPVILNFIGEAGTCAEDSEMHLTRVFKDGHLGLRQVTASTVAGFEKLSGSVKEMITSIGIYDANDSADLFVRLWNAMNTSPFLSSLFLPIPADIGFNLKHLTSIRVFETYHVISMSSLAHVLTFLPRVRELIIQDIELVELDNNAEAFCELWKNLHTSPDLNELFLPIPTCHIMCDLEPLRSVQILETMSSSINLPFVLINLPNLQKLLLNSDILGYPQVDAKGAHKFFGYFLNALHNLRELRHLRMYVPETFPALHLEPLRSVQTFQTKLESHVEIFPLLLSRLPNISELYVVAMNNYDSEIAEDTYYDKVISAIIDGVVKNGVQLEVLNMTFFDPRREDSKSVSRDTVENFIRMLKTSGMMRQLEIISFNYCVFKESDLIEIITAIREFTSIMLLRIDCSLDSEGELTRFATERDQPKENKQGPNQSKQSGSLMLTLFYRDPETNLKTEETFVLPRSQYPTEAV